MDYLARETSPIAAQLWQQIDAAAVGVARNVLTGRRILHLVGPLGPGADSVAVDDADARAETAVDGIVTTKGRKLLQQTEENRLVGGRKRLCRRGGGD